MTGSKLVDRPARRRYRWLLIALAVVIVLVVAGNTPSTVSVPIAIALVCAAAAWGLVRAKLSPTTRISGLVTVGCGGVGGVLMYIRDLRIIGLVLLCLAAVAAVLYLTDVFLGLRGGGGRSYVPRAATPAERSVALLAGLCLAAAVLGITATSMRGNDGYYLRYGVSVTADTGDGCQSVVTGSRRATGRPAKRIISCQNASWQIDGTTVHGLLTSSATNASGFGTPQVAAYAIGHEARAADGLKDPGPIVVVGKLTPAWLLAPLPVALVVLIVMVMVGRRRVPAPA